MARLECYIKAYGNDNNSGLKLQNWYVLQIEIFVPQIEIFVHIDLYF